MERYLLRVTDAVSQGSDFQPVSLVSSVDFDLLDSLIDFDTFPGVTCRSQLTDDGLLRWLNVQDDSALSSFTVEELDLLVMKSVRVKLTESDPKLRMMALFTDYRIFLRSKKLDSLTKENTKIATRHISGLLRPSTLRRKIENDLALHKSSLKKDWKGFYKYVVERAVACEQFVPCTEKDTSSTSHPSRPTEGKQGITHTGHTKSNSGRGWKSSRRERSPDGPTVKPSKETPPESKEPSRKDSPGFSESSDNRLAPLCLNQKTCPGERHYINQCPKCTQQEKKQLLDEYLPTRSKKSGGLKQLTLSTGTLPPQHSSTKNETDGRIRALFADTTPVAINGDYGSDHAALSEDHLNQLAQSNVFVSVLPLSTPITMELAVKDSSDPLTVTAARKARISTTLKTKEGPFRLRNVEYLVFKEPMDEVLLSRPLLQSLGFNLDEHLARVRSQCHDVDCSHITFAADSQMAAASDDFSGTLSGLVSQEPTTDAEYLDESDDDQPLSTPQTADLSQTIPNDDIVDAGDHVPPDILPHLRLMVEEAIENGLPQIRVPRLQRMLEQYADVFRLKLGSDPPVDIPPMNIRLIPDAEPVRVKVRRYATPQAEFLRKKVAELERLGLVRRNIESSWACAPLIVPKPGPEQFRFTTDLRPVNKLTLPHAWPMPDLETVLASLATKTCFATIDLCHDYWQLPLAADSLECQSFITPDGVYTPTRVMHGQRNAVAYCQSSVQLICQSLLDKLLLWLDDMLFHGTETTDLLDTIEEFFKLCRRYGLKLHAAKCKFFLQEVNWCGRVINSNGVRMDPARLKALLKMPHPENGDELQQFVCAANWMRAGIVMTPRRATAWSRSRDHLFPPSKMNH